MSDNKDLIDEIFYQAFQAGYYWDRHESETGDIAEAYERASKEAKDKARELMRMLKKEK